MFERRLWRLHIVGQWPLSILSVVRKAALFALCVTGISMPLFSVAQDDPIDIRSPEVLLVNVELNEEEQIVVSSTITDDREVASVELFYRFPNKSASYRKINLDSGSDSYRTTIPVAVEGDDIFQFYLVAADAFGNVTSYGLNQDPKEYSYSQLTVTDSPIISDDESATADSAASETTDSVTIPIAPSDRTSTVIATEEGTSTSLGATGLPKPDDKAISSSRSNAGSTFYTGVNLIQGELKEFTNEGPGYGIHFGFNFNNRWAIELGYGVLGTYSSEFSFSSLNSEKFIAATAQFRVNSDSRVIGGGVLPWGLASGFLRLGASNVDCDSCFEETIEPRIGLGFDYKPGSRVGIVMELFYTRAEYRDFGGLGVGLELELGR